MSKKIMDNFLKRKSTSELSPPPKRNDDSLKRSHGDINLDDLPADPGLRPRISDYNANDRDQIRRAYLLKGPCQPRNHTFPKKKYGDASRGFNPLWFNEYGNWLEYSIAKDAAFCLCCYLFKPNIGKQAGGDSFVTKGFSNWKKKEKLRDHVGKSGSAHNDAWNECQSLMNQKQHIQTIFSKHSNQASREYRTHLTASLDCIRFLLRQGLPFCGHDESEESSNQGNFLQLLHFLVDHNEEIKAVALKNAPENHKLTAPYIQKDIVSAAAAETINAIIREIGDSFFSVLVDESRDISTKEQMAVVLRYVDKKGHIIERFLGIEHITSTTALSLKTAIEELFSRHGLSISRLRGQGYDGASNMQGELNGLKTIIMKENECAFYIHCFSHQLQLTLVAVAKNHERIALFFHLVGSVVNTVGASCKRRDILREKQATMVMQALEKGELSSGRGLNQETSLIRSSDTRWGSHYGTLVNLHIMFSSVIDVLQVIAEDGSDRDQKGDASSLLDSLQSFEFVFHLHLMKEILGITNELSQALQRKDQDIVNAMALVEIAKQRLQTMRENGWESLLDQVSSFCSKHSIVVPTMDDIFVTPGRPRRNAQAITNLHHYLVEFFYAIIDSQLQELNSRFTEANTELLICVACLSPKDSFSTFDKQKLIRLAQLYPKEFSAAQLVALENQLGTYIIDMHSSSEFLGLKGIGDLSQKMVQTKKDIVYLLVYLLVTLALILPVGTATVERVFSAMKIVKSRLRNRMGDEWMNNSLVVYIEKDIFDSIDNEIIIQHFQNMKTRRGQL